MKGKLIVLFCALIVLAGCKGDRERDTEQTAVSQQTVTTVPFQGCRTCHQGVDSDLHHDFPCSDCHKGDELGIDEKTAHSGLVAKPAHPDSMAESCGGCHPERVQDCKESLHFTLRNEVNQVREHFDARKELTSLTELSPSARPTTPIELVDDMLRRRCLRCHLFSPGDTYADTRRGTGCAACHMEFSNGELLSHTMSGLPADSQCLSCHYANFVGADYYGRYEQDFGREYRTPFTTREEYFRPYGVEYHELAPDIHQQRGLSCVDCHAGHQPSAQTVAGEITCRTCHQVTASGSAPDLLPANLKIENNTPILTERLTGKEHPIPQMTNPAHEKYNGMVDCQVCHAQWSFNDTTTHLLRSDTDDYESWSFLTAQSSSTVENLLEHNLNSYEDELPPAMPDTVTGIVVPGVWYKGFTERRWERMLVQKDRDGRIKVFRPILDLRLSYVDSDEDVVFDNLHGSDQVQLPYTPHTTGKAGLFYLDRFAHLLNPENLESTDK